jgi:hypothetical protein
VHGGRARLGLPGHRARRVLADQPAAPPVPRCGRAGPVAGCGGGHPGPQRGRDAAGRAPHAARPGLPRRAHRRPGRRLQHGRHRRGRGRARTPAGPPGPDAAGGGRRAAAGRLGREGLGHGPGPGRRRVHGRLRAVHRRRHRLGGRGAAGPGARGRGGRPGPGLADGAAADGDRVGTGRRPGVRLLLRPAVPVPPGELAPVAHGRGGRRLHARAPRGPRAIRRAGPDQRRPHRRRGPGPGDQAPARALLARADHRRGQRAPVPQARRPVADGGPVRLHPAAVLSLAAGRDRGRAGLRLPAAAGRGDRRAGGPAHDGGRDRARRARRRRRTGGLGADVGQLPAHAAAVPAVAAARARAAADRPAVRRDDHRFRAAALRRPGRGVEGPDGPGPVTLAGWQTH